MNTDDIGTTEKVTICIAFLLAIAIILSYIWQDGYKAGQTDALHGKYKFYLKQTAGEIVKPIIINE